MSHPDKIEILSTDLLEAEKALATSFRKYSARLGLGLGWHYLLDLAWVVSHLRITPDLQILDAGAGFGLMQWWLADQGVRVISVDRMNRAHLPQSIRTRYQVQSILSDDPMNTIDLTRSRLRDFLPPRNPRYWRNYPIKLATQTVKLVSKYLPKPKSSTHNTSTVTFYDQDLNSMPAIPDNSIDVVVAISALEHNNPEKLPQCIEEMMRVLRPGGYIIATLCAAKEKDWFHKPSQGWCYTEHSLRDLFNLPVDCPSNYGRYDELFKKLRNCAELRDNLADFYYKSGENGMPWGVWDPQYQPVGILKNKELNR